MPLPLCLSQVRCRLQDTTKRKQARVLSSVLLFKRSLWVLKEVLRLEKRTPCGALLARTACARPPTRTIMKLRSTFSTGRRCVLLGHPKPQGSRPAHPFVHWEGQNRSCSRSHEAARYRNGRVIFLNFRCFFKYYTPVCECAFRSFNV